MTDTAGLPPGCKPLTFDPNDRATWKSKLWFDGVEYQPAEIVCVQNNVMLIVLSSIARCSFWLIEPHKYGRLYDAAPEPVKPREWWALMDSDDELYMNRALNTREAADSQIETDHLNPMKYRLVRLGELPLEAPEDQA